MGASYGKRASHWSSGEYADANNVEDDTAIIARTAPVLADDHANGVGGATRITAGTPTTGAITTRTDTDAFTFSAYGRTALAVSGPGGLSDLDVRLTILTPLGANVATIDPTGDVVDDAAMSATWSVDLPAAAATYVAVVDGTGFGTPTEAGPYSDYGSLGAYAVTLSTGGSTDTPPPTTTSTTTPTTPTTTTTPTRTASLTGRFATVLSGDGGSVRRVFRLVVR